jgi:hypothetical protein
MPSALKTTRTHPRSLSPGGFLVNVTRSIYSALGISASLAILAGCSGGSQPSSIPGAQTLTQPQSMVRQAARTPADLAGTPELNMGAALLTPSWMSPEVKELAPLKKLIYVSCFAGGFVNIYKQAGFNQAPIGQITGLMNPNGLYVDSTGNLYVANESAHQILVYPPGATTPSKTLDDTGWDPVDIAIDTDGTVYVANLLTSAGAQPGSVSVYKNGSLTVSYLINDPNFQRVNSVALTKTHTLYVTNNLATLPTGPGDIITFKRGSHGPGHLPAIKLKFAGGIKFDSTGDFVTTDQVDPAIERYKVGKAKPFQSLTTTGEPYRVGLNTTEAFVYVANATNSEVDQYSYPALKMVNKITKGFSATNQPIGVALAPAAP